MGGQFVLAMSDCYLDKALIHSRHRCKPTVSRGEGRVCVFIRAGKSDGLNERCRRYDETKTVDANSAIARCMS